MSAENQPKIDPTLAAKLAARTQLPRRFYKHAQIAPTEQGFELRLDGKAARTPARVPLAVPTAPLGEAMRQEWEAQGDKIDPATMPITRLANSAIDGVRNAMDSVREDIVRYGLTDLLYYRAVDQESLAERQREVWDPVIAGFTARHGVRPALTAGVMHVDQPEALAPALARALQAFEPFGLTAVHIMTTLTGSALLALAVAEGELEVDEAWRAAHVDEDWQIARWGEDEEAMARRRRRERDMRAAAMVVRMAPRGDVGRA